MKLTRSFLAFLICLSFVIVADLTLSVQTVSAQDTRAALQRGYRTGYSDGYMAGYRDSIDNLGKDLSRHTEYSEAKRAYNTEYGALEDYSDGYRQGFELGYAAGFDKLSFESTVPSTISRRGAIPTQNVANTESVEPKPISGGNKVETPPSLPVNQEPASPSTAAASDVPTTVQKVSYSNNGEPIIVIPRDLELIVEIQEDLNTQQNREGDKFTAKVMSPFELEGAIIEGRIDRITKPGRIKRRSEMLLSFDRIVLSDERWANFDAILTEVLPIKGDNVRMVDTEGTAIGKRSIKDDSIKIGAATGAGIGIGAIAAGPVGAAVGAGVGAAFGVGAVVIERGKHIRLNKNQQLRIRTAFETKIR